MIRVWCIAKQLNPVSFLLSHWLKILFILYVPIATTLKKVMDLLQTVAKKGRHHPKLVTGQPCAAVFSVDNLWYRAEVISIATTTAYVRLARFP